MTSELLSSNTRQSKAERFHYVDLLETLAIFFVIIYHTTIYPFSVVEDSSPVIYLRNFMLTILSTCVPLFFFVNGYLLLNRPFSLKKHIKKSLKLVMLTWIWAVINVLCMIPVKDPYLAPKDILLYIFAREHGWIHFLWYMGILIHVYVFFPLLKNSFDSNRKIYLCFTATTAFLVFGSSLVTHLIYALQCLRGLGKESFSFKLFSMFNPFKGTLGIGFAYFCLGGLAYEYRERILAIPSFKRNLTAIAAIFISCIFLLAIDLMYSFGYHDTIDPVWEGYTSIATTVNVLSLFVLSLNYKGSQNWIQCISRNTLGIYFMHELIGTWIRAFAVKVPMLCTFSGACLCSAAILLLSLCCVLILQKIPVLRKLVCI